MSSVNLFISSQLRSKNAAEPKTHAPTLSDPKGLCAPAAGVLPKKNEPFPATRSWRRRERSCRRVLRRTGVLLRGTGRPTQLPGRVHKAKGDLHALTPRFQYYLPGGCCFGGIGLNGDVVEMRACPLNPTASLGLVFCQIEAFGCTSGWAMAGELPPTPVEARSVARTRITTLAHLRRPPRS